MALPNNYCDFCLGDSKISKKTGQPEGWCPALTVAQVSEPVQPWRCPDPEGPWLTQHPGGRLAGTLAAPQSSSSLTCPALLHRAPVLPQFTPVMMTVALPLAVHECKCCNICGTSGKMTSCPRRSCCGFPLLPTSGH